MTSVCGTRRAARQPSAGYSRSTAARAALWSAGVAVLGLAADAAGRAWALSALRGGHRITVVGGLLRFQLVINHGAAFGIAAGYEPLLAVASVAGIVLLGICAVRASSRAQRLGAALAAGGAAGNLLDRLARPPAALHGGVVDWLHVPFYAPTFNLADLWLRGGLLLAAGSWLCHMQVMFQTSKGRAGDRCRGRGPGQPDAGPNQQDSPRDRHRLALQLCRVRQRELWGYLSSADWR
ncbi:MAG: signal peptidase II [Streptosporangiaceae bacterium]